MNRLSILQRILLPLILAGSSAILVIAERTFTHSMEEIRQEALGEANELGRLLQMTESLVEERVNSSMWLFMQRSLQQGTPALKGSTVVQGREVPSLVFGDEPQSQKNHLVDGVTSIGNGTATLFVKNGNSFVRIATNVQQKDGSRAVGTLLDPKGKVIEPLRHGQSYYGVVDILGDPYITGYEPISNADGAVIGAWYVGYKVDVAALDQAIKKWTFLDSGFAAVVDYNHRVRFLSENTPGELADKVLKHKPDGWTIVSENIPAWNFQVLIAYPNREAYLSSIGNLYPLMILGLLLGIILLALSFFSIRRFVLMPLGGDPETATALVRRVTQGNLDEDGTQAAPDTLIGNMVKMRARLREMVEILQHNAERLSISSSVFEHAHDGIFITDSNARIIEINPAFAEVTGYTREEALGRSPHELGFVYQNKNFFPHLWHTPKNPGEWRGETWNRHKNGNIYAAWLDVFPVKDETQQLRHYVGLFSDISLAKEQQQNLEYMAYHDSLTQLPNRSLFADRLQQALALAARANEMIAICYLDLDGFKPINDTLGHAAGDRMLVQLAARLRLCLRESDTIARLGGDEFAVLLGKLKTVEECDKTLGRLLAAIEAPFMIDDRVFNISASIGYTVYPLDDNPPDTLLRHADHAMYQAKINGGGHYHLFDLQHDQQSRGRRQEEGRIRAALQNAEFRLFYQPKIDMRSGTAAGFEALIRWQHPDKGLLSPAEFLPVIEDTDFVIPMGEWVIREALRQLAAWQEIELTTQVSVNIAARHIMQKDFAERLAALLQEYPQISPQYLELEITETAAINDIVYVADTIRECKQLGVSFAIDDFGVGYSSLTYLRRLPVNTIKIDRSFIRDMLHDNDDLAVIAGIISLSRDFNRTVVAEGVETEQQGLELIKMGCTLAQGYGIAQPMPADTAAAWVAENIPFHFPSDYPPFKVSTLASEAR